MTNPDDRMDRALERLGAGPEAAGGALIGTAAGDGVAGLVTPDTRPLNRRCGICLAGLHPQRKVPIGGGEYGHRLCASMAQPSPLVLPAWLRNSVEQRRRWLWLAHGCDPVTGGAVLTDIVAVDIEEDDQGVPARLHVHHHPGRVKAAHLPVTAWDRFPGPHVPAG